MTLATPLSAPARFALVIDGLCRAVAARIAAKTIAEALITLIWRRLRRIDTRFQALVARFRAGTLRVMVAAPRHAAPRQVPGAAAAGPAPRFRLVASSRAL